MAATKTLIATGVSSGIGFELIKQLLLDQPTPYRFILGVRSPSSAESNFDQLGYDKSKHTVSLFPCDYADLQAVKGFAGQALKQLGSEGKLDELLLNHGMNKAAEGDKGPRGSQWDESYIVNHLSQHYLMHLLRPAIARSHTRVVFVSSGAVRVPKETSSLRSKMLAGSGVGNQDMYCATKFAQLLGAHWWRRELGSEATVVAVSPGMIPGSNLGRHVIKPGDDSMKNSPDAKSVPEGARSILEAFKRDDLPKDPNAIFLTSWGEWWKPEEMYPLTLDKKLQDEHSPSQAEIEKEENIQ